jgi:hypothetical protein
LTTALLNEGNLLAEAFFIVAFCAGLSSGLCRGVRPGRWNQSRFNCKGGEPFSSTISIAGILLAFYQVILLQTGYNQINSSG